MNACLLDTSVIIDYLKGKPEIVDLINNLEGEIFSSYICMAELYEGVNRVKDKKQMAKIVDKFFSSLNGIYGVDQNIAQKFGEIRADLKRKGNIIEDLDLILAATCLVNNLTLITLNQKHFSHVDKLELFQFNS